MSVFLIASAAYVDPELVAEFGKLPPAFLPLGSRRLFVHQYGAIAFHATRVVMSLPEGFVPDAPDKAKLTEFGIDTIALPEGLTLGESVVRSINMIGCEHEGLSILHGDSLLTGLDYGAQDAVSVIADPPAGYSWGWTSQIGGTLSIRQGASAPYGGNVALNGFFAFSDARALLESIDRQDGDFVAGVADYATHTPLQTLVSEHWFDFGHSSTYHRSRRELTTEREFNNLKSVGRSIIKTSRNQIKIDAEASWFEQLPPPLRVYTPGYLGRSAMSSGISYSLEYMYLPSLTDLSVFGRLGAASWDRIFQTCDEILTAMLRYKSQAVQDADGLYLEKTLQRLDVFARSRGLDLCKPCRFGGRPLPSLVTIAETVAAEIPPVVSQSLVHGDFCFSNLLYDLRSNGVRMIDPRGLDASGHVSIYGDPRYDIAKLYHSAVGLYDHIVADNYVLTRASGLDFNLQLPETDPVTLIRDAFLRHSFGGMPLEQARSLPIAILLFLSMPPLHAESAKRQDALLANGLRLFDLFDRRQG